MSTGARIATAVAAIFFAGLYTCIAFISHERSPVVLVELSFCLVLALACAPGKIGHIALRTVAASISLGYICYLGFELTKGKLIGKGLGEPGALQAILGSVIWGIPFGYLALFGFYPPWAFFGRTLGKRDHENNDSNNSSSE